MQRAVAAGVAVGLVAVNVGAVWYLRDRMSTPPSGGESAPATLGPVDAADDRPFVGSVLLAGASDGSVLRLTHGSCEDGKAASASVAPPGAGPVEVELPGLVQTLGLAARSDGWYVVGADEDCEITAWSADLGGEDWETIEVPDDAWYLDPSDTTRVLSPQGPLPAPTGCTPTFVQAVGSFAFALCEEGSVARTPRVEPVFALIGGAGVGGLAARSDGRVATVSRSDACASDVKVSDDQRVYLGPKCVEPDKAGLGVAWIGDRLVLQVGYDLLEQDGDAWTPRE